MGRPQSPKNRYQRSSCARVPTTRLTSVPRPLKPDREHQCYNRHSASQDDRDLCTAAQTTSVNFVHVPIARGGYVSAFSQ